ncbi:hypothetical protein JCM19239_1587 [Vibrio variabilis]|uniref:Uncharacterized protein n=1 Tax=Vibrio variabilis TaxID=990271 RepID=A0ABQ0JID6_9VIBR|nr:hypothetical protein JCM19239_1587 [Vibrio variabilis]
MPCIKYKHNYALVSLNGSCKPNTKSVSGNTIPALLRNGDVSFLPFTGFIKKDEIEGMQLVKLINIVGFTTDDSGIREWYEIPKDCYCIGVCLHKAYKLVLSGGIPLVRPLRND